MPPIVPNLLKDSRLYKEQEGVKTHLPLYRSGEALIYCFIIKMKIYFTSYYPPSLLSLSRSPPALEDLSSPFSLNVGFTGRFSIAWSNNIPIKSVQA